MFGLIIQSLLIFLTVTLSIMYFIFRYKYKYWERLGVHYEEPTMLMGNLTFIMRKSFWEFMYEMGKKWPRDYYGIFLGWQPALVVHSPIITKRIIQEDSEHFQNRYSYSGYEADPLGTLNLFTVKNPIWTEMRHKLSPLLTSKCLKAITELMNINSEQLVQKIQRDYIDDKKPVDLKELFSMYTSDTVAYTVFGLRVSALNDHSSPLWMITRHMVKWTFWRGFEFTMIFLLPYIATVLRLTFFSRSATDYIKQLFWNVVKEREKSDQNSDTRDLVNHLLRLKENMKLPAEVGTQFADDLMLAQAAVFILGAIETSSSTLSYCLHELAHHPKEQDKLYEEVINASKTREKHILQYQELLQLKYLTACIHETLRKYPPVPHLDRLCNKAYKLNEHLTIEKGVPVFINVVAIHHDEQNYPEPEQWRPERFNSISNNDNRDFTFLPFGDGPRFCIGKRYGMMQIRTALAQMIVKYRFEPCAGEPYNLSPDPYSVVLTPTNGGKVKFVPR